jgi:hypothetical protein
MRSIDAFDVDTMQRGVPFRSPPPMNLPPAPPLPHPPPRHLPVPFVPPPKARRRKSSLHPNSKRRPPPKDPHLSSALARSARPRLLRLPLFPLSL